jgi:hypothetical protein
MFIYQYQLKDWERKYESPQLARSRVSGDHQSHPDRKRLLRQMMVSTANM